MPDVVTLSLMHALAEDEIHRQRTIVRSRRYYGGPEQHVKLTDRLRALFRDGPGLTDAEMLRLNIVKTVVKAVTERLLVTAFPCDVPEVSAFCWRVWQQNRMDQHEDTLHTAVLRDGEAFLLVTWDGTRPRLVPHDTWVDADIRGLGTRGGARPAGLGPERGTGMGVGCKAFWEDDDPSQPLRFVSKRWIEERWGDGTLTRTQRLTLYYPDRVEKYAWQGGHYEPYQDAGDPAWPLPWVDRQGRPLGVAMVPFLNHEREPEALEAIPLQNAVNKLLVDLMTASDETAFRIFYALGFIPTTDGAPPKADKSNWWQLQPGQIVGTARPASETAFGAIDGADLRTLIEPLNQLIFYTAMATDTPVSRFLATAQIAAEGTLKQQEAPLVNKIRKRQSLIGNGYEDALLLACRVQQTFGAANVLPVNLDTVTLDTQWEPAETRDERELIEGLALKREKLGVPLEQIWREAGYTEEQIAAMQASPEYQARLGLLSLGGSLTTGEA